MKISLPSVDLQIANKLLDRAYRQRFFLVETSANIAAQLINLRKLRKLTQAELAELAGTGQPAISRSERADYHSWSFSTLRSLANALDARIRVVIEPAEAVLQEYTNDYVKTLMPEMDIKAVEKRIIQARGNQKAPNLVEIFSLDRSSSSAATAGESTARQAQRESSVSAARFEGKRTPSDFFTLTRQQHTGLAQCN